MRFLVSTTAIALSLAVTAPAYASDSNVVNSLNNQNLPITTDNLNQAMLDMMNGQPGGNNGQDNEDKGSPKVCDPKSGLTDDPNTEQNECDLGKIAPAAGDDGGDDAAPEETVDNEEPSQPDEVNDPEPPKEDPPVVEEQKEPEEQVDETDEGEGKDRGDDCFPGSGDYTPPEPTPDIPDETVIESTPE